MFAYRRSFFKGLFGLVVLVVVLFSFGCGDDSDSTSDEGSEMAQPVEPDGGVGDGAGPPESGGEDPEPDVADADAEAIAVISEWSETLSEGDVEGAAELFAIPSIAENGGLLKIRSREDAILFNEALPCGASVLSAETTGEITTVEFRLSERPGGACGPGAGGTASTSFVIEDGKIAEWRRVGTNPGSGGPTEGATTT